MADPIPKVVTRVTWRYVAGRPLNGVPKTDAGYLRRGTRALDTHATGWAMLPGWKRQAVRLGTPAAMYATAAAYTAAPTYTTASVALLTAVGGTRGLVRARRAWRMRRFRAVYIRPTVAALRPALGDAPVRLHVDPGLGNLVPRLAKPMSPAETAVRTWYGEHVEPVVRWLPDRAMRGAWAIQKAARPVTSKMDLLRRPVTDRGPRIELVASVQYLTLEQRLYVAAVIGAKIPVGELVEQWDQVGTRVTATWTVRKRPPASVRYADLAARLPNLKEWEFFLGLGVGGKPVIISLKDDSPHIAVSAGSGAGKSVLAQLIAVQVLARGGQVVILDLKGSHRALLGMPGVDYCTKPEQMHNALIRLADLADQRNNDALHEEEGWEPGERVFVIAEELNATFTRLKDYWVDVRLPGDPKVSPAVKAFRNITFMGRSAKVNMLVIAQMLTANTTGGPESRENYGIRCLARYTKNNWQMLVPEAAMPRASRTLGRWQIVVGGQATECQVAYLNPAEARLFVHKERGKAPVHVDDSRSAPIKGERGHVDTGTPLTLTLQDAIDERICPWALPATQKRLQRARAAGSETVPAPVGKRQRADLYERAALIAWFESELVS